MAAMRTVCSMVAAVVALGMAAPAAAQYGQPVDAPFRAGFYLRGGTMTATGDYAAVPGSPRTIHQNQASAETALNSGMAATSGFYGELGRLSYLPLPLPAMLRVGIDAAVAAGLVSMGWDEVFDSVEQTPEVMADARIGPVVSVMPIPGLRFDASLKFGVGVVGGSGYDGVFTLPNGQQAYISDEHDEFAQGSTRSMTLSVRYGGFTAGWEVHSMEVDRARWYYAGAGNNDYDLTYTGRVSPTTRRLFIGFAR
jgi:opacity protein-like surface antigen